MVWVGLYNRIGVVVVVISSDLESFCRYFLFFDFLIVVVC